MIWYPTRHICCCSNFPPFSSSLVLVHCLNRRVFWHLYFHLYTFLIKNVLCVFGTFLFPFKHIPFNCFFNILDNLAELVLSSAIKLWLQIIIWLLNCLREESNKTVVIVYSNLENDGGKWATRIFHVPGFKEAILLPWHESVFLIHW